MYSAQRLTYSARFLNLEDKDANTMYRKAALFIHKRIEDANIFNFCYQIWFRASSRVGLGSTRLIKFHEQLKKNKKQEFALCSAEFKECPQLEEIEPALNSLRPFFLLKIKDSELQNKTVMC